MRACRSHQLKVEEVAPTVRCIVRCGAGVNNIPVPKMTELGIPVFNTPGALLTCCFFLRNRHGMDAAPGQRSVGGRRPRGTSPSRPGVQP